MQNEWIRLYKATHYSLQGLKAAWQQGRAFRSACVCCLIGIPLALYVGTTAIERALLIASLLLVLMVELINSAIEAVVDRISLERHDLSKRAKDLGSAAVFLAIINAVIVWLFVLFL